MSLELGYPYLDSLTTKNGITFIKNSGKYDSLFDMNVKETLKKELCLPNASSYQLVLALTLGRRFGWAFLSNSNPLKKGKGSPEGGTLYKILYRGGMAEDNFSTWELLKQYFLLTGEKINEVKIIYERAMQQDAVAKKIFGNFGEKLAAFLSPIYALSILIVLCLEEVSSKHLHFFRKK